MGLKCSRHQQTEKHEELGNQNYKYSKNIEPTKFPDHKKLNHILKLRINLT